MSGARRMIANGYGVSLWSDDNVLKLDYGDSCITFWTQWTVNFKSVDFMVCEWYLSVFAILKKKHLFKSQWKWSTVF